MQRCGEVTMTITSQDYFIEPSADTSCLNSDCAEPTPLSPYWVQPVPSGSFQSSMETLDVGITRQVIVPGGDAIFVWALNQTSLIVDWKIQRSLTSWMAIPATQIRSMPSRLSTKVRGLPSKENTAECSPSYLRHLTYNPEIGDNDRHFLF